MSRRVLAFIIECDGCDDSYIAAPSEASAQETGIRDGWTFGEYQRRIADEDLCPRCNGDELAAAIRRWWV